MKAMHYTIIKDKVIGNDAQFHSFDGYKVTPRNTKKYGVGEIHSMTLINPSFIEKVLKKKIKKKLDFYLKYIISLIDDDEGEFYEEDTSPSNLSLALNDLAHYKSIVEYKYRKYLDEKYINLLLKKIDILEHEIKAKLKLQQYQYYEQEKEYEYEEEKGKSR